MNAFILRYYIQPHSVIYKFFAYLHRYLWLFLSVPLLVIGGVSGIYYQFLKSNLADNQQRAAALQTQLEQQTQFYTKRQQEQHEINQKDNQIIQLNQQIQKIVETYNAKIENLQWQFEGEKTLYLMLNHKTETIFTIIQQLNQLPSLKFKEINLIKLNRDQQIQLNATLILMQ